MFLQLPVSSSSFSVFGFNDLFMCFRGRRKEEMDKKKPTLRTAIASCELLTRQQIPLLLLFCLEVTLKKKEEKGEKKIVFAL